MSTTKSTSKVKELDSTLLELLADYQNRHSLTHEALGKRLGTNGTYVSRAYNKSFTGDAEAFQAAVRSLLEAELQERHKPEALCEHGFMVKPVAEFLDSVKASRSIGVTHSPPGKGKSKALLLYQRKDPLCILVTASQSMGGWRGLRDAVLDAIPNKRRLRGESWDQWLVRTFKSSGRLLIIDNAHLLTKSARKWIAYDWHDFTKIDCPVALVGNDEILPAWSSNDQLKSRVGVSYEVKSTQRATDTAREMIRIYLPGCEDDTEAVQLASTVLKSGGACRATEKHLLLAGDLMKVNPQYTAVSAIKAANSLLLTDVKILAA